ncbi:hypothetical protein M0802_015463 [Mischocyttarus mexicanus]|nr:hypothetical protein M0802_015463 [Mischocyttarus mexicanus]
MTPATIITEWKDTVLYAEHTLIAILLWIAFTILRILLSSTTTCHQTGSPYISTEWRTFAYSLLILIPGPCRFGKILAMARVIPFTLGARDSKWGLKLHLESKTTPRAAMRTTIPGTPSGPGARDPRIIWQRDEPPAH